MLRIDVTNEIISREKRDKSGSYERQVAYAHTCDQDGKPEKYPRKIFLFVGRNGAYATGSYQLAPQSIQVGPRDDLEMRFPVLVPLKSA